MQVSATHLAQWADKREAQGILPVLVRRLISATSRITTLAMPGRDSVNAPGWDGVIEVEQGNAWTPRGISYWELGTSKDPASKASSDFEKRLGQISAEQAAQATFVFVTPRRWPGKEKWQMKARHRNAWAEVLVWDADDLEAWLENSPPTTLWLGIQLGIAGYGIDAIENFWEHWSSQSSPPITTAALFNGREESKLALQKRIQQREQLIAVQADSQAEAVAFVCALLIDEGYSPRATCVTSEEGWQFVDANPGTELVVVTDNRLGSRRSPRDGTTLIVPMASGDQAFNLMGLGGRAIDHKVVELQRPKPAEFENSLLELGITAADAARYARTMGRSWTVFRRWQAQNPAIKKPEWAQSADSQSLLILALVGAWNSTSDGDKACVTKIANQSYEDIENALLGLVTLDDAPVVKIGPLWKAKAPLELLHLMAPRLTGDFLTRFFQVASAVFEEPDPALDLEEDKRWLASVYGKVREQSGVVMEAIADSIAKLGYFSDNASQAIIRNHVQRFVSELLENATGERWLSVSPFLRSFAEAAPEDFLSAIEASLRKPNRPVTRLITETQSSGISGRCWHANLLWALELLAWYPTRLGRIANILAELSDVEMKSNWANTPFNSLVSLFRPWYPQTATSVDLRLRSIRNISERHPKTAWKLLLALLPKPHDMASPNARPRWRDDDAGTDGAVTYGEIRQFILPIADILLQMAQGNAQYISELVPKIGELDINFRNGVIALIDNAKRLPDQEREIVRGSVRKFLNWENSFNQDGNKHDRYSADALRPLFDALSPDDLVIRHAWAFSNGWIELPDGREEDHEEAEATRAALRLSAIREIYQSQGWQGIDSLGKHCKDPGLVGWELINAPFEREKLVPWLCQWYLSLKDPSLFDSLTSGVLHALPQSEILGFLSEISQQLTKRAAAPIKVAGFMANAPQSMALWQSIEDYPQEVRDSFWSIVRPFYLQSENSHLIFCIEKLLAAGRSRTAMETMGGRAAELTGELLTRMLRGIAAGEESDAALPQSWYFSRVFQALAEKRCPQSEIVSLEFAYYPVLEHDEYGTPNLINELLTTPKSFMELMCLAFRAHSAEREPIPENMEPAIQTASAVLQKGRGVPGQNSDGEIDRDLFFEWINTVRKLAKEEDREAVTDLTIGSWLSNWPLNQDLKCWPDPTIAELLDQDDAENIRRGFLTGVYNARGVTSRLPYDGGTQERGVAKQFRSFSNYWTASKPVLGAMIENLSKSFEHEAEQHDEDSLWSQEAG